jgi:hypothetical protein
MTKAVVQKIAKKQVAPSRKGDDSVRSRRFKALAEKHGARSLESKIGNAIQKSDERRKEVREPGMVTVAVS